MKKFLLSLLMLCTMILCTGCPFLGSPEHKAAHRRAIERDFTSIHKTIDRHVWNYDWDDPYYN